MATQTDKKKRKRKQKPQGFKNKLKKHSKVITGLAFKPITPENREKDIFKENLVKPDRIAEENKQQVSHEYFSRTQLKVATHTNAVDDAFTKRGSGWTLIADEKDERLLTRQFYRNEEGFFEKMEAYPKFYQVISDDRPICPGCRKYMDMILVPYDAKKHVGTMVWMCTNKEKHTVRKKRVEIGKNELLKLSKEQQAIIRRKEKQRLYYFMNREEGVTSKRSIRTVWKQSGNDTDWIDVMIL